MAEPESVGEARKLVKGALCDRGIGTERSAGRGLAIVYRLAR